MSMINSKVFIKSEGKLKSIELFNNNNNSNNNNYEFITHISYLGVACILISNKNNVFIFKGHSKQTALVHTNKSFKKDKSSIKLISSSFHHLIILKESGLVYGFLFDGINSSNTDFVLGNFTTKSIISPLTEINQKIDNKNCKNNVITHILSCTYSSFIVFNGVDIYFSGKLFSFSSKSFIKIKNPEMEDNNKKIKRISSGFNHVVILYENGNIYGIGDNHYGQSKIDACTQTDFITFTKMNTNLIFKNKLIIDAYAIPKSHINIFITKENEFYIYGYFGFNEDSAFKNFNTIHFEFGKIYQLNYFMNNQNFKENGNYNLNNEWTVYGSYTTIFIVNGVRVWVVGRSKNTNPNMFKEINEIKSVNDGKEKVVCVCGGSDAFGILIGEFVNNGEIYMKDKLLNFCKVCCCNESVDKALESKLLLITDITLKILN
ncbi:hypothetical protein ABK040_013456 [Willaertia magna]